MVNPTEIDDFLARIMNLNVLRMGGAAAGIVGSSGADSDILYRLKKTAVAFASECRNPAVNRDELQRLSGEVAGLIQTLQLTSTLSDEAADKLLDQLQNLTNRVSK